MRWSNEEYTAYLHKQQPASSPGEPDEKTFLARVLRLAKEHGYETYHTHDSRKSAPGFPDCILAKPGYPLLCVELKTNTGKPTMEQLRWLSLLQHTEKPQAALWRPQDWDLIVRILTTRGEKPL